MSRAPLPPLPPGFRGCIVHSRDDLDPWSGASGPFWHAPRAVLRPRDAEDVSAALDWAGVHGIALIPRGGGTGMPGGNVGPEVVLDLLGLQEVGEAEAGPGEDMILAAEAGAVASRLRVRAREAGMDLPALPSSAAWCTLGGMVACNAAGARSFGYGPARSWVRSLEWVRADGSLERLSRGDPPGPGWVRLRSSLQAALPRPLPWPDVRKNSSGYALDAFLAGGDPIDLIVGSEGTLGVVTAATLSLQRPPSLRTVALVGVPSLSFLVEAALAVDGIHGIVACEYFGRRLVELGRLADKEMLRGLALDEGVLLLDLAGGPDEVEGGLAALGGLSRGAGMVVAADPEGMEALWEFRHAASPTIARELSLGRRSTQFIEDSVVPVPVLGDYVTGLREILGRHRTDAVIFGHAGDGNLHVNPLMDLGRPDWRDRVREILDETVTLVASLGGTLAGEHGDGRLRTPFLDRIFHPSVVAGFATVKESLDPGGILNPGVVVPVAGAPPLAGLGDAPAFASGSQGPEAGR